ncbi:MAG: DNA repair exonuclease [Lawsonibacter sp.]|nr:DNA repair exonuclease [Lawsonibacter sp.]
MLNIIHGADFHLDSPFSGLTPERAAQRRGEQRELLEDLARLARDRNADLVLLAGDLLDSELVYRETAQALAHSLGRIPCPVFLAPGNHDFYSPRSVYATLDWPDNVHIFTAGPGQEEGVDLLGLNCTIYGWAFHSPHLEASPMAGFRAEREPGRLKLAVLHGDVEGTGDYGPLTREDIAGSGLDYLALGHIHQCSGLQREGDTFWAYPGCPAGRGFDEQGDKGVLCLELEPGRAQARFVPLGRRRYRELTVDMTGAKDPLETILAALPPDVSGDICRLLLTGEGPAPDLPALERELSGHFYGLTLRDHTRLPQDLWKRRGEDTLTGLFLQVMWDRCQQEPQSQTAQLAARFGLAALENGEDAAL